MNGKSKGKVFCAVCSIKCVGNVLRVQERYFHLNCFRCSVCSTSLAQGGVFHIDGKCYCTKDYQKLFGIKCYRCEKFIEGKVSSASGSSYYLQCLSCARCRQPFPPGEKVTYTGKECVCSRCLDIPMIDLNSPDLSPDDSGPHCVECSKEIQKDQRLKALDKQWHVLCFRCTHCKDVIRGEYMTKDGLPYCKDNALNGQSCSRSFYENFTIEHIPGVIRKVIKLSKSVSSSSIDTFICRHFLKITNTSVFLEFSVKVIEYICRLDIMVHSESQVFEAIMKWIGTKSSRKRHLLRLLKCVRWCHLSYDDLKEIEKHDLITKSSTKLDKLKCSTNGCSCELKRAKQHVFIYIFQGDESLHIMVEGKEFSRQIIGEFTEDNSISLEFIHSENISDVIFDSGKKGIRIDWTKRRFRWLDCIVAVKTYYRQINESIIKFSNVSNWLDCYLQDKDAELSSPVKTTEEVFLESNGKFIALGKTRKEKKLFGLFPVIASSWFKHYKNRLHSFHATVLDNVVYILTKDLKFIRFNYDTRSFKETDLIKNVEGNFDDLILTSLQANDDRVILTNKSTKKIYFFSVKKEAWIHKDVCFSENKNPFDSKVIKNKLIVSTSSFLPMKHIKPVVKIKSV